MIEVLPNKAEVDRALGWKDRVLILDDCPEFDISAGDVNVKIDRVVAHVDRDMTRLQWRGLGSKLVELLVGGGSAVIAVPANILPGNTNVSRLMEQSGLVRDRILLAEKIVYMVFKRDRTVSTWNIEGELRRQVMGEGRIGE